MTHPASPTPKGSRAATGGVPAQPGRKPVECESHRTRAAVDPLVESQTCRTVLSHYVSENERDCPLLSPLTMDLSGLPPLCIHVGDHEILLSDSVRLAERARVCNIQVEFKIWPHMWHVFQGTARFVPEGRESIEEIGRFVANHLD